MSDLPRDDPQQERGRILYLARQARPASTRDKYAELGEPMPTVIVAGGDPMTFLMGTSDIPTGTCEYDVIGGFRGEAMKLIEGKHTGLPFRPTPRS